MNLRMYQEQMLIDVRVAFGHGHRSVLLQAPTGSGKTAVAMAMLSRAQAKGRQSWFLVHRRELLEQAQDAARQWCCNCEVHMVQTLARHLDRYPAPEFVVVDEVHHCRGKLYERILEHCKHSWVVGLTATPCRLDGQGLRDAFECMVQGPSVTELIHLGYLSPFRVYGVVQPDLTATRCSRGDYSPAALAAALDKPLIIGNAVKTYQRVVPAMQAIVFAPSVAMSEHVAQQFREAGIVAEHLDGDTPVSQREIIVSWFRSGLCRVLCNVDLFGEGFDVPSAEVLIELRPTKSLALHLQHVGRVLRPKPGKIAIILDHAGNCTRHGFPDEPIEWTLDGHGKHGGRQECPVRICGKCFLACPAAVRVCPGCGTAHAPTDREVRQAEGELVELQRRERKSTHSLTSLVALGISRGYKNPTYWAKKVMEGRARL